MKRPDVLTIIVRVSQKLIRFCDTLTIIIERGRDIPLACWISDDGIAQIICVLTIILCVDKLHVL